MNVIQIAYVKISLNQQARRGGNSHLHRMVLPVPHDLAALYVNESNWWVKKFGPLAFDLQIRHLTDTVKMTGHWSLLNDGEESRHCQVPSRWEFESSVVPYVSRVTERVMLAAGTCNVRARHEMISFALSQLQHTCIWAQITRISTLLKREGEHSPPNSHFKTAVYSKRAQPGWCRQTCKSPKKPFYLQSFQKVLQGRARSHTQRTSK